MKRVSRRSFIIGGATALLAYSLFEVRLLRVKRYTISIQGLPPALGGLTVLHLSDLHDKQFGESQKELLDLIHQQDFDLVAITGDLVNRKNPKVRPGLELVEGLQDKPVYFVPGNHDWWVGFEYRDRLAGAGVRVLENRAEKFAVAGEHLWVVGVDDPYTGRDNLDKALAGVTDSAPRLLLAHAPNIYEAAVKSGIDLALVGHTHGGQVRLPLIGAVVVPGQGFFPKLDYGLYTTGKTTMIINGGLGESHLPIRFNIKPEIVLVSLRPALGVPG